METNSDNIATWIFGRLRSQVQTPERIYHYTSPTGLLGILQTRVLWGTDVKYLNDASELQYTIDLFNEALIEKKNRQGKNEIAMDALNQWETVLQNIPHFIRTFAASFSEEKDLLSQWRAYSPVNGGFSLGFTPNALIKTTSCPLVKCIYEVSVQQELIEDVFIKLLADYSNKRTSGESKDHLENYMVASFATCILFLGGAFKHPSFREEREWRLIAREYIEGGESTMFREGRSGLVPYRELSLGPTIESLTEIVIGPNQHPHLAFAATQDALIYTLGRKFIITPSSIPYRNW